MIENRTTRWVLLGVVLVTGFWSVAEGPGRRAFAQQKEQAERRGTVAGMATAKGGYWIEVQADGEEKARRYYCGSDPVALKAVKDTEVGSRVRLEWRFQEVFRVVKIEVLRAPPKEKK